MQTLYMYAIIALCKKSRKALFWLDVGARGIKGKSFSPF